jgi:hypothetical protein
MARALTRLGMVVIALALVGCSNRVRSGPVPGIPGELGFQCVWSSCVSESIAIGRCASNPPPDAATFRLCMRYEGYQALACSSGAPDCTPKLQVLY